MLDHRRTYSSYGITHSIYAKDSGSRKGHHVRGGLPVLPPDGGRETRDLVQSGDVDVAGLAGTVEGVMLQGAT
jgi:hypothetical protein